MESREPAESARSAVSRRELAVAILGVVGLLALFLNKAFTIDDPLFLALGRHLQHDPLDFYGFDVHWYAEPERMAAVTKNPPLAGYFIALAAWLVGWSEPALHAAFLVPAAAVVAATYGLARRFGSSPLAATWAGLWSPVFLVSSTNVMCDTLMLALWSWSVLLWVRGLDQRRSSSLWWAAVLASLAFLTKYFAIALLPLLAVYAGLRERAWRRWCLPLGLPVLTAAVYELVTQRMYPELGVGLLRDAMGFASATGRGEADLAARTFVGLAFAGGCLAPVLLFTPLLASRRVLAVGALGVAAACALAARSEDLFGQRFDAIPGGAEARELGVVATELLMAQGALWACAGLVVVALALNALWSRRDPDTFLLVSWLLGTLAFAAFVNWVNNGRSNLPMAPVVGILLLRRVDAVERIRGRARPLARRLALAASAGGALAVAWADYDFAGEVRHQARTITERYASPDGPPILFQGHWGFQYYMEQGGARPWNLRSEELQRGQVVVLPVHNVNVTLDARFPPRRFERLPTLESTGRGVHTMAAFTRVSFYASDLGALPFAFGRGFPERYYLWRVREPFRASMIAAERLDAKRAGRRPDHR